MNWLRRLLERWQQWRGAVDEPFDLDFPDSAPPIPDGLDCPTTQPGERLLASLPRKTK